MGILSEITTEKETETNKRFFKDEKKKSVYFSRKQKPVFWLGDFLEL